MKLISLNTWGGKCFKPLVNFIKQHAKDTDIFCFQEIYDTTSDQKEYRGIRANLLWEINHILPEFQTFYLPVLSNYDHEAKPTDFKLWYGQGIWIRKSSPVNYYKEYIICDEGSSEPLKQDFSNLPTPLQNLSFTLNGKTFNIYSFHGTPYPADKLDSRRHLQESQSVKKIIAKYDGAKILVGDFNLLPNTKSIKIFEKDMKNLIKEFNIQRTRGKLSPFYGRLDFQKFADFTFVSNDVQVKSFQVPDVDISDHLPMILEFS